MEAQMLKLEDVNKNQIQLEFIILKLIYISFQLGYLGSGANARVHKALYNNQEVAVKMFNKRSSEKVDADFFKEVYKI